MKVFVVDGQSNQLVHTLAFAGNLHPIEELFDTGDEIICRAYDKVTLSIRLTILIPPSRFQVQLRAKNAKTSLIAQMPMRCICC